MKRKYMIICFLAMVLVGCATINLNPVATPEIAYYNALSFFNGAWQSYHKVWLALPEAQKTEWVLKYHVKFQKASKFLDAWSYNPQGTDVEQWRPLKDELENLLISLAIKK